MQLQKALSSLIDDSRLPFFKAIMAAKERVKVAELAYVKILLENDTASGIDVPTQLFDAARAENYVKSVLDTLVARYMEAYGDEFDEKAFEVRKVDVLTEKICTIVALKGQLPETITRLADLDATFEYYAPGTLIYASATQR